MKRQLSSYVLLLALISPLMITSLVINVHRAMVKRAVKRDMMNGIPKERLKLIVSHAGNEHLLDWEHDREFEFMDQMYDVVYTSVNGDTTRYWCWEDHKETALNQELAALVNQSMDHKSTDMIALSFFKPLYSENSSDIVCSVPEKWINGKRTIHLQFYQSLFSKVASPPPLIFHGQLPPII